MSSNDLDGNLSVAQAWRYCQWNWVYLGLLGMRQPAVHKALKLYTELRKYTAPSRQHELSLADLQAFAAAMSDVFRTYHGRDPALELSPDWHDLPTVTEETVYQEGV